MTPVFPHGVMVTVTAMTKDRYGARTASGTRQVGPCAWAPGMSTEDTTMRDTTTRRGTLYAPPGSIFAPTEIVVFPGSPDEQWEVLGGGQPWRSPFTGWNPGVVVELEKVSG